MRYVRYILVILAAAVMIGVVAYFLQSSKKNPSVAEGKIFVAASFYPLAEFAKNVGGQHIQILIVTPAGAEPHDYEPSIKQISEIESAQIFIMNGGGLDPWGDKLKPELIAKGTVVIDMSEHFKLLPPPSAEEAKTSQYDPHIWVDPVLAEQEVRIIRDGLIKADPSNVGDYTKNADAYLKKLSDLDQSYRADLVSCSNRKVVTSHAAFGYLGREYGFEQIPIAGLSPDEEPSPRALVDIVNMAKQKHIQYIFFETLVSPKLAQTIAQEIGAKTLVFNPLEGLTADQIAQGQDYISIQQQNLENLKIAMQCK